MGQKYVSTLFILERENIMKDIIIVTFFIICIILLFISIIKKHKYIEIDTKTQEENKKIKEENTNLLKEQNLINALYIEKQNELNKIQETVKNINAAAHSAFNEYEELLSNEYCTTELEYEEEMNILKQSYNSLQDSLISKIKIAQADLDKISATRAAAIKAQLKEEEIKNKQTFYCPQVPENELKDAKILRDIEYKLNNPRVLRMLIWQTYYQKPMNQVCANVLGAATAEKCGI